MAILDVELLEESQTRYLTYALSVVNSRALPDVRDGLKPVQRRILYAMGQYLNLTPDHHHRKSAAVVGEVLGRFHPHGDSACYEALVRMAQDFSYRYPLIDGQGNFGSLDGDSAAAYRYTEAKLTQFALEVIGDIGQETVAERPNFDQTTNEPIVLPSRVPNLLVNGASGIAVGMATAIPPHNLRDVVKALLLLMETTDVQDAKLVAALRGPDFPTGCLVLNTAKELQEIYKTGRGPIRMRADYNLENGQRGKSLIIVTSIPYAVDKSSIVQKIADLIISRKVPQLVDVRDESTAEVRIVLELAPEASAEKAMAYLFKHTPLQANFNVNLTALLPTKNVFTGRPALLSLREMLQQFIDFRLHVTRCKLSYEKGKLEERIHLLEGLERVCDVIKEVIEIVRKSDGRQDAAAKLRKKYSLSELQAYFVVDLRIYQLSRTNIEEVRAELKEKRARVAEIDRILKSEKALAKEVREDLERVAEQYGDNRRSKIVSTFEEEQIDEQEYLQHENVFAIITKDGWMKRIRNTNDPQSTRLREGDSLFFTAEASTKDSLALMTNFGNLFVTKVFELSSTSGFGEPVQKMFRFQDGEAIVCAWVTKSREGGDGLFPEDEFLFFTERGLGFRMKTDLYSETKRTGKRLVKLNGDDRLAGAVKVDRQLLLLLSRDGYGLCIHSSEVPLLTSAGKGVILQRQSKGDKLAVACFVAKNSTVTVRTAKGSERKIEIKAMTFGSRAHRGEKVVSRDTVDAVISVN